MPFEEELSDELRRTGEIFDLGDRPGVVAGGIEAGRRRQRRRTAAVTGSVLALALVGAGGAFAGGLLGGSGTTSGVASGERTVSAGAGGGISDDAMVRTLQSLLPAGKTEQGRGRVSGGADGPDRAEASVVYDDGKGRGTVSVSLYATEARRVGETGDGICGEEVRSWAAEESTGAVPGAGGSAGEKGSGSVYDAKLTLCGGSEPGGIPDRTGDGPGEDGALAKDGALTKDGALAGGDKAGKGTKRGGYGGISAARALFFTRTGVTVDLRAYNGVLGGGGVATRPKPVLGGDALVELSKSSQWQRLALALKPDRGDRTDTGKGPGTPPAGGQAPELDYGTLMPTFLKLLPKGLPVVEKRHEGGEFAYAVADDGKGRSLVQINVQRDMRDAADALYAGAETLPDGTRLRTTQQPGEKGGEGVVQWTADTMRPDGMRVVVSAFNSGEQSAPATRDEPALTMEQLTALATSPEWLKLQQK
ncbi:hypothetical protein [Streptomyces sp. NPDC001787]|uniref:hypothetical protein n=1 Tax=Streptomyces sp. NPDC001787 TaxID=3154523 RepID=UPI003319025F